MRRRFFWVLGFALVIFSISYAFLFWQLALTFQNHFCFGFILCLPFVFILAHFIVMFLDLDVESDSNKSVILFFQKSLQSAAYFSMPVLSLLVSLFVMRIGIFAALFLIRPDLIEVLFSVPATLALFSLTVLLVGIGAWIARRGLKVRSVQLFYPGLNPDLNGINLVQISDLHMGATIHADYVKKVVDQVNALQSDFIVLTGDIGDGDPKSHSESLRELSFLKTRGNTQPSIFYVTGNHEYYWGGADWIEAIRKCGITPLLNSNQIITRGSARLGIAGVTDSEPDPKKAFEGLADINFRILLAHQPGIAEKAAALGFDLQLSGHTHGGQFFPWTLVIRKIHRFHLGLFQLGKMKIYVNAGTGSWGPPIRLGTRPEITHLFIRALKESD